MHWGRAPGRPAESGLGLLVGATFWAASRILGRPKLFSLCQVALARGQENVSVLDVVEHVDLALLDEHEDPIAAVLGEPPCPSDTGQDVLSLGPELPVAFTPYCAD